MSGQDRNTMGPTARQGLKDIGDIAQDANNIVAKIGLRCQNPELAAEAKTVFESLLVLNATLVCELGRADARGMDRELADMHTYIAKRCLELNRLLDLPDNIMTATTHTERRVAADSVRHLLFALAFMDVDVEALDAFQIPPRREPLTYDENVVPDADVWRRVTIEHATLLALVRCYRFMIEATPEMLESRNTSRVKLLATARALELKAAMTGIDT